MKRYAALFVCLAVGSSSAMAQEVTKAPAPAPASRPSVQIAILLDTSGSMNGLIAQAKTQLWTVVNEFVKARKGGQAPTVQVALFEYGKSRLSATDGFVRLILPLTDDLDKVSEELFALQIQGGEEYCGWVIREAVNKLEWNPSSDVYKAIFIAGNEAFSQGPVDFQVSCRSAIERGILVNTIFCGPNPLGSTTGWKDGALLADGRYMSIDQNQKVVEIATPHDAEIARLGVEMNKTYIPFGKHGMMGVSRQAAQDANASAASPGAIASRSYSKVNSVYNNDAWDLVDAIKNGKSKLEDLKDEDLSPEFQKLDQAARKAKVEEASKQRGEIKAKILTLNKDREMFLEAERKKQQGTKADTLDQAIVKAVREQATRKLFTFE